MRKLTLVFALSLVSMCALGSSRIDPIVKKGLFPGLKTENETEVAHPENLILMGTFVSEGFKEAEIYSKGDRKLFRVHEGEEIGGFKVLKIEEQKVVLSSGAKRLELTPFSPEASQVRKKAVRRHSSLREAVIRELPQSVPTEKPAKSAKKSSRKPSHSPVKSRPSSRKNLKASKKTPSGQKNAPPAANTFINLIKNLIKKKRGGGSPPFLK